MKKKISLFFIFMIFLFPFFNIKYVNAYDLQTNDKNGVYNILLIGVDGVKKSTSRADSMIIFTIDNNNKNLKLSSIARDTLVKIPGRGYEKINHAFNYGGANLLLKTINENLKLNITDYAMIDFNGFVELINILGGVEINIQEGELDELNNVINDCYGLNIQNKGNNIKYINSGGNQILNGYQALAYCRLRKVDNCFSRDERQRQVLKSLANKLSKISLMKYPQLIDTILQYVRVNISIDKILRLACLSKGIYNYEIKQLQFPNYIYRNGCKINSQYVIEWQEQENLQILHNFIYNE